MIGALLTGLHVLVCLGIILVVLLQAGKGGGLSGSIGGSGGGSMMSGAQMAFGGRGTADILSKATTGLAIAFMVVSLVLSIVTMKTSDAQQGSKIREMLNQEPVTAQPFNAANPSQENLDNPKPPPSTTPKTNDSEDGSSN
ncbi:MAG: preprotein translocase subunit SecG [Candidatus Cloacimonetes bacterium 4572_55]|nr:MAG: preprotein translocase subunit SecG [Candidatus Cloacimonetes bacterium 4572_55]